MRPKSFNENDVLRTIEDTFRRVGYDGASLEVLTRATGLNRSSLYNAFGCKHDMMRRAVETYTVRQCALLEDLLAGRPFRSAVRAFLLKCVEPGVQSCLLGNLVAERAEAEDEDRVFLAEKIADTEATIALAFAAAQRDGEIDPAADPVILARHLMANAQGLRILSQAREDVALYTGPIELALTSIPFTDRTGA